MRIEDISPREETMIRSLGRDLQSISGKGLCVALSADGTRAYLGGHSGVWRSDDGGETWWHPEWRPANPGGSTLPGALIVPNVYDLLIDPANNNIVLAATGRDARKPAQNGIYRSTDQARGLNARSGRRRSGGVGYRIQEGDGRIQEEED
jgi:hypothetical protein